MTKSSRWLHPVVVAFLLDSAAGFLFAYSSASLATAQVLSSAVLLLPVAPVFGTTHGKWNAGSILSMFVLGALGTGFSYIKTVPKRPSLKDHS